MEAQRRKILAWDSITVIRTGGLGFPFGETCCGNGRRERDRGEDGIDFRGAIRHICGVIGKLTEAMEKAAVRAKQKSGGLSCPECGEKGGSLPPSWEELMVCANCGARASLPEWAASAPGAPRGRAGEPPAGTAIRVSTDARGGRVWEIPASRRFNFFLFFALFWLAVTALVSGGFLLAFLSGQEIGGDFPEWALIPFFGIFWAVGLGMLYAGLRQMLARHTVTVCGGRITLRREMLGRVSEKSLACAGITACGQREFYQQNYRPVYGIEIRGGEGKIRFGTMLGEEEKEWLAADLAAAVLPVPVPAPGTGAGGVTGGVLAPMKVGGSAAGEPFSAVIPGMGAAGWWMGLLFALMGGGFTALAFTVMEGESWFGFRGIWALFSSCFALIGLGTLVKSLLERGKERRIEGNAAEISLRTYRNGLILSDRSFPRREVSDIRASLSGSSGSTPMKRVELIVGGRAVKIASWIDGDEADALVSKVRGALGGWAGA